MSASAIIPTMRYHDARRMIGWLEDAFGFRPVLIVDGEDGSVAHAQLILGDAMIMIGDARDDAFGANQQPAQRGQPVNQSAYLVVEDPDALYESADAAGAEIVEDLTDADYGGRGFVCRDPEGQLWSFGSYDPWADAR